MRPREVGDVDIVADRRAVEGRIVGPEDADGRVPLSRAQHQRDEMGLGVVRLAVAFSRARRVEVAQRGTDQIARWRNDFQHLLGHQLRGGIGVFWVGGVSSENGAVLVLP